MIHKVGETSRPDVVHRAPWGGQGVRLPLWPHDPSRRPPRIVRFCPTAAQARADLRERLFLVWLKSLLLNGDRFIRLGP